jgi:hypothetical protein
MWTVRVRDRYPGHVDSGAPYGRILAVKEAILTIEEVRAYASRKIAEDWVTNPVGVWWLQAQRIEGETTIGPLPNGTIVEVIEEEEQNV